MSEVAVVEEGCAVGCVDLVQGVAVSAVSVCLASCMLAAVQACRYWAANSEFF